MDQVKAKLAGVSGAAKDEKIVESMEQEESFTGAVTVEIKDEGNCSKASSSRHENTSINKESELKDEGNCSKNSSPRYENSSVNKEDEQLKSTKAEMSEVKEENERLRKMLHKIESDYQTLQMRFFDILQRGRSLKPTDAPTTNVFEEPEISLCLGRSPVEYKIQNENTNTSAKECRDPKLNVSDGLTLGLDLKCPSETDVSEMVSDDPNPDTEETKEDEQGETWPPSKVLKTPRSENEEPSESTVVKRARVSVRARCDTPTMHDGCQWRKYGQKTAKGNPCPRAYYRCTLAPSCPVRKQVQRCPEDMSILMTTYEGTHSHPLPVAATTMASTTSAAASILLSRSSTSQGITSSSAPSTSTTANINGLNYTLYDTSRTRPFNLPNTASPTPPTIVLDLTTNPSPHLINRFSHPPKLASTSLDFTSSSGTILPTSWGPNNYTNYYNNNNTSLLYNKNPIGSLNFAKPENIMNTLNTQSSSPNQQFLTETLAKVLTSAPSFQSAVAAAISNMVGAGNFTNTLRAPTYGENGDQNQMSTINPLQQMGQSFLTSYHSNPSQATSTAMTTSSTASPGSFLLHQSTFPLSVSKSSSSMAPNIDAKNNNHA